MKSRLLSRILLLICALGSIGLVTPGAITHAQADGVSIKSSSTYLAGSTRVIAGEVANGNASGSIWSTVVAARLFDRAGNEVGNSQAPTFLTRTRAGETTPFRLEIPNAPGGYYRYELILTRAITPSIEYQNLTILSQRVEQSSVKGTLRNDGTEPVLFPVVAVTFYNTQGQVIDAAASTSARNMLAPGESVDFEVAFPRQLTFASITMRAEASVRAGTLHVPLVLN